MRSAVFEPNAPALGDVSDTRAPRAGGSRGLVGSRCADHPARPGGRNRPPLRLREALAQGVAGQRPSSRAAAEARMRAAFAIEGTTAAISAWTETDPTIPSDVIETILACASAVLETKQDAITAVNFSSDAVPALRQPCGDLVVRDVGATATASEDELPSTDPFPVGPATLTVAATWGPYVGASFAARGARQDADIVPPVCGSVDPLRRPWFASPRPTERRGRSP